MRSSLRPANEKEKKSLNGRKEAFSESLPLSLSMLSLQFISSGMEQSDPAHPSIQSQRYSPSSSEHWPWREHPFSHPAVKGRRRKIWIMRIQLGRDVCETLTQRAVFSIPSLRADASSILTLTMNWTSRIACQLFAQSTSPTGITTASWWFTDSIRSTI